MKYFFYLFKTCLGAFFTLVLALAALIATGAGRVWMAETVLTHVSANLEYGLEWRGLRSPALNHWQAESIALIQNGVQRHAAAGIDLRWDPLGLFRGRLILEELRTARIVIGMAVAKGMPEGNGSWKWAMPITIRSFFTAALELRPLGENWPREFRIRGALDIFPGTSLFTADLEINPLAAEAGMLTAAVKIDRDGNGFFSGRYSEGPGGPVNGLLSRPRNTAFETSFRFTMDQNIEDYRFVIQELAFTFAQHDINIRGILQQDGMSVTSDGLLMEIDDTVQVLTGRIASDHLDLDLDVAELPLDLLSQWTEIPLTGSTSGHLGIRGSYTEPSISAALTIQTIYRDSALAVDLTGTATRDQLLVENAIIRTAGGALAVAEGKLALTDRTIDLRVRTENTSLEQIQRYGITMPDAVQGVISAQAVLRGRWDRPEFEVNGIFTGLYKEEVPLNLKLSAAGRPLAPVVAAQMDDVRFDIEVTDLDLRVKDRNVTGAGRIMASGQPLLVEILDAHIGMEGSTHAISGEIREQRMALTLNLEEFPLDVLSPLIKTQVSGTASGAMILSGTFAEPLLRARIDSDLSWRQVPLHLESVLSSSGKTLEIERLLITGDDGKVQTNGLIDFYGDKTRLEIIAEYVDAALLRRLDNRVPAGFEGRLNGDLTVTGTRALPHVAGAVDFAGRIRELPATVFVAGHGDRERFFVENLEIRTMDEGRLSIQGEYGTTGFKFEVSATALPSQLFRINAWELPSGFVAGSLSAKGTIERPDVTGIISFDRKLETAGSEEFISAFDAEVNMDMDNMEFLLTMAGEHARTGKIEISLPWRQYFSWIDQGASGPAPLTGTIRSEAYLQELCSLLLDTDIHDCKGRLLARLNIGDTFATPRIDGTLVLEDGYYENTASGTSLRDVYMDIKAVDNRIEIVKATAGDGDRGTLELEGGGRWHDRFENLDVNLALHARDAHLLRRYDMDGTANGNLTLTGDRREMFLSGTLDILPFTLSIEALLEEEIPSLRIANNDDQAGRRKAERRLSKLLPAVNLNVELAANQQAFLRGPGLEAELQGKILIQGTYPDSVYRGDFKTKRGYVRVLGKRFDLVEGEVRLEDEIFSLFIPGVYQSKNLEVRAELAGTLDELRLDLSSTPAYPEDEIISQLLFNKTSRNISPLQALRLANAVTMLKFGGRPLFDPLDSIQKNLTIDSLNVEDAASGAGIQLGVGKYIHEKVYVEVETGAGAGEPWQGNIQIELLPNLNLENSVNGETGFGNIELQWKKDY